jgi:hypothetical protein
MLECEVKIDQPTGDFALELSCGVDRFQASWNLATGECVLKRLTDTGSEALASAQTAMKGPGKYRLRFANMDERLTLWVDSGMPFGDGVIYPPPRQLGPTKENDLNEPASIGTRASNLSVSAVKLWRDTYYTVNIDTPGPDAGATVDLGNPTEWAPLRELAAKSMYVQPGHYLCMGDNSPESSDGRSWGTVPRRLLLGRALTIYYPFNRIRRIE